jgi:phage terminase Nu1 subunit (DNA packaging protein)
MNRPQLATFFDVSLVTVDAWVRRGCPHKKNGRNYRFDCREVVRWRLRHTQDQAKRDLSQEGARLARAQARKHELELAQIEGRLVDAEEMGAMYAELVKNFRDKVRGIPRKVAARTAKITKPGEIEKFLLVEFDAALLELSEYDPESGNGAGAKKGRPRTSTAT